MLTLGTRGKLAALKGSVGLMRCFVKEVFLKGNLVVCVIEGTLMLSSNYIFTFFEIKSHAFIDSVFAKNSILSEHCAGHEV